LAGAVSIRIADQAAAVGFADFLIAAVRIVDAVGAAPQHGVAKANFAIIVFVAEVEWHAAVGGAVVVGRTVDGCRAFDTLAPWGVTHGVVGIATAVVVAFAAAGHDTSTALTAFGCVAVSVGKALLAGRLLLVAVPVVAVSVFFALA
jgi:hypothetical protein